MRVKNAKGTATRQCRCGSWLRHWEKFARMAAINCSVKGCTKSNIVGGHVEKKPGGLEYIVPLCKGHNHPSNIDWMELNIWASPVKANKQVTCE